MALNFIWIAFFLVAFVVALIKLVVFGDTIFSKRSWTAYLNPQAPVFKYLLG